eukprot:TRINITY_DN18762_c0_g1_i1.p1 TRINITY_DN18762_c0_g1~~TRINITY_DN18762_c0_g1_i1.p1  ORF type:complete len:197 (+),score=9.71 TRINITY_DN18762_c0_g1_i1:184-774(+)
MYFLPLCFRCVSETDGIPHVTQMARTSGAAARRSTRGKDPGPPDPPSSDEADSSSAAADSEDERDASTHSSDDASEGSTSAELMTPVARPRRQGRLSAPPSWASAAHGLAPAEVARVARFVRDFVRHQPFMTMHRLNHDPRGRGITYGDGVKSDNGFTWLVQRRPRLRVRGLAGPLLSESCVDRARRPEGHRPARS